MHMSVDHLKVPVSMFSAAMAVVFAAFLFLDDRHSHPEDVAQTEDSLNNRLLMAESTRYAEVEKYYTDRLRAGEKLSQAELDRLDLVQRQQHRIAEIVRGAE